MTARSSGKARGLALALVASLACVASSARADDAPVAPDAVRPAEAPAAPAPPRPWAYADDATTPAPLHAVLSTHTTYSSARATSTTRPFASNLASPGGLFEVGGEVGVLPTLALSATGVTGGAVGGEGMGAGMTAGLRLAPLAGTRLPIHAVVAAGFLREMAGANGFFGRVAATYDVGRLRMATTVHGERVLARGRDAVDVLVVMGALYKIAGPLRAGVEYVAQDLEGFVDREEAEGGVRHFVGPTAALELLDTRLTLVASPGVGLSYATPRAVGRIGLSYAF